MSSALRIVQEFFPNVDDVKDAKKAITIEVTPRDEATSKKRAHKDCAMAIACKRTQGVDGVIVSRSMAYLITGTTATRYFLPMAVQKEVVAFDRGGGFSPGEYELLKPPHVLGDASGSSGTRTSTAKAGKPKHITANVRTVLGGKAK